MALDATGLILIILFFIRGYMKGIIMAVFSVLALLCGMVISLKLSQSFATWLLAKGIITNGWALLISYLILFIGVVILVRFLAKLIQKVVEKLMLGIVNKIAGGLLYGLLAALFWSSLLWIGTKMHIISPQTIASSKTYSWLSLMAPAFFNMAGNLLPVVKDTFSNLEHFFTTINQKLPSNVGTN